jgi:sigma-B regulation protein RsbU (phosphoserine phosphatase)
MVNAGHPSPLLCRLSGELAEVTPRTVSGLPIGVLEESTYTAREVTLAPGDAIVLFSDGVTDAMNGEGKPFGANRLAELLREGNGSPRSLGPRIVEAVHQHAAGCAHPHDDVTLVCFGRTIP